MMNYLGPFLLTILQYVKRHALLLICQSTGRGILRHDLQILNEARYNVTELMITRNNTNTNFYAV